MQWRGWRALPLQCDKLWSLLRPPSGLRHLQVRPASNAKPNEQSTDTPDAASCPAQEPPWRSTALPPKGSGIWFSTPPEPSTSPGVSINRRGQLKVLSRKDAEKECPTALILSASSTSLTSADFTTSLHVVSPPEGGGGIEAAIPGRHARSLDRLPYWILLFKTPYLAAYYQSRLRWYHQNAVDNLPVSPLEAALIPARALTPPPGYIDPASGEDVWERLREYSLLQPIQRFSVTALLPKFPHSVDQAIHRYKEWNEFHDIRFWTARIRIFGNQLTAHHVFWSIVEDGIQRERPWGIMTRKKGDWLRYAAHSRESPMAVCEESTDWHKTHKVQDFSVKFTGAAEATRFWRTWHRRPFPGRTEDASVPDWDTPTMRVELTW